MTRVGRSDRRTVGLIVGLGTTLLSVSPTVPLSAQVSFHLGIGARYTTPLVRDSIRAPIAVRAGVGPVLALSGVLPLERGWTAQITLDLGWAGLERDEVGTATVDLGSVRTLAFVVAVRRPLASGVSGGLGIGVLKYFPADRDGIFRDGPPPFIAQGSAIVRVEPPVSLPRALALEARYDLHRFTTPALRSVGFRSPQWVHRVALLASVRIAGAGR